MRFVFIGDAGTGTGKSSLVVVVATEQFLEHIPMVMPHTRVPANCFHGRVPIPAACATPIPMLAACATSAAARPPLPVSRRARPRHPPRRRLLTAWAQPSPPPRPAAAPRPPPPRRRPHPPPPGTGAATSPRSTRFAPGNPRGPVLVDQERLWPLGSILRGTGRSRIPSSGSFLLGAESTALPATTSAPRSSHPSGSIF